MSIRKLPSLPDTCALPWLGFVVPDKALERWNPSLRADAGRQDNVIEILDIIGKDFWTDAGVQAKDVYDRLSKMKGDVTVLINSPGGIVTEGNAIYNMLREYDGQVTVRILGMAASIASIIAMAADKIEIARSGFMMIHNASTIAMGTRHEMQAAADWLDMVDADMREIYALRSGLKDADLSAMMDRETYLRGQDAINKGLADSLLKSDAVKAVMAPERAALPVAHRLDVILARAGMSREDRRKMLKEFKTGTQIAAEDVTQIADMTSPGVEAALAEIDIY